MPTSAVSSGTTDAEKIRRLPWLVGGDTFNIMFVLLTFSGSVFVLFLDELGLDTSQIGILLAVVPFCGVIAPLISPVATRIGYKRIFIAMRGLRNIPMLFLLLTPIVLRQYGQAGAFLWVAGIIFAFAVLRAVGETGGFSWRKEIVPDTIQGKFAALNSMITTVASMAIVLLAGYVIEHGSGLQPFILLIGIGIVFGFLSVLFFARAPSDDRAAAQARDAGHWSGMRRALGSPSFRLFLFVLALATVGGQAVISFVPLFMKDLVGLSEGVVVLLSIGTYLGALFTSYFWGWAADRYSSKPVMQVSLVLLILLPVFWLLLPRHNPASAALAMAIAVFMGIATLAWQISWTRYLYVNALPKVNRAAYLAVYFAWLSIVAGTGPLLAGRILSFSSGIAARQVGLIHIDRYTPLFLLSITLLVATMTVVPRLKTESGVTFRRFAGMFLRGNPVRAMWLLIQYNQSGDEMTRVVTTEQMGDAQNLLTSEELIQALHDPTYNVRVEAIHSIGRMPVTPELRDALIEILEGPETELGMATARALGRLGAPEAIPALRRSLGSRYDLIAAESARALAQLGDVDSTSAIAAKMRAESNPHLQVAYASALGKLGAQQAVDDLFGLLCSATTEMQRGELGLAIARFTGDEKYYLQRWRSLQSNFATATAQAVLALRRGAARSGLDDTEGLIEACAHAFAAGDVAAGVPLLQRILRHAAEGTENGVETRLLCGCADAFDRCGHERLDLVLLSLHVLNGTLGKVVELR